MNSTTDEEERRKRSLEAGREMLQRYKAERLSKAQARRQSTNDSQTDEESLHDSQRHLSDEESLHGDKCLRRQGSCIQEGISSKDITQSSMSISEGEGDADLEGMAGRVAQLEEMLNEKEAIVETLNAEIDNLRAEASSPNSSQSQSSSIQGRDIISLYHTKLQEFEKAINQRDTLIEDLTSSLEQTLSARDALVAQLNSLNAMQIPAPNVNTTNLQEKINALEAKLSDQNSVIHKLNTQLSQSQEHVQTLEMEKETRSAEINDYKVQINNLNEQIRLAAEKNLDIAETLEQQKQYEARVDKIKQDMQHILEKFTMETNANAARHQQEIKEMTAKHEIEIKNISLKYEEHMKSLKDENKVLTDRLNKELPDLESRHAKELSIFQAQLAHYKKTVESLKHELVNRIESQQTAQAEANSYKKKLEELKIQSENARRIQEINSQKEKELLTEQVKLHKIQIDDIMAKYVAATTVLESKESIERSLEQALTDAAALKQENDILKFKLDDMSSRYSIAQSLIDNNQAHERTLNNRIFDLEKSLSRFSGMSVGTTTLSELNETTYQTMDEVALQYQLTQQKLDEKAEMERLLVEKVQALEEDVSKREKELEQADIVKRSYEKQLKDMKNICDKMKNEITLLKESNPLKDPQSSSPSRSNEADKSLQHDVQDSDLMQEIEKSQREIENLKKTLEEKELEINEYVKKCDKLKDQTKKAEEECQQLKNGLATAWAQCADVEEKLNQTLALNDSKIDITLPLSEYSEALNKHFKMNKTVDETLDMTTSQRIEDNNKSYIETDKNVKDAMNVKCLQKENENLLREMESLLGKQLSCDDIICKLHQYYTLCQELSIQKEQMNRENTVSNVEGNITDSLQKSIDHLKSENETLRKDMKKIIDQQKEEISAIKAEAATEAKKMQSLLLSVKEGNAGINDLKAELEMRHAKEMEELRTYFEQKCLQMEKQYSEEIFSQQSKKISDNDSEIEELTEDLYFGGPGDCLTVSNISGGDTPIGEVDDGRDKDNREDIYHIENKERCGRTLLLKAVNQALLALESDEEANWPYELLQLREKFTSNAKREMKEMKESHNKELARLKEEHSRNTSRMIKRHQEELNKIKAEYDACSCNQMSGCDIRKERDRLNKTCAALKDLVGELIKYFIVCEEEVNNVLINEVLKKQAANNSSQNDTNIVEQDETLKANDASSTEKDVSPNVIESQIKRVHFAPQSDDIVSLLNSDNDTLHDLINKDEDITEKLKEELNACLHRLKKESAQLFDHSTSPKENKSSTLSNEVLWLNKVNDELNNKLQHAEALIMGYQDESERLKVKIIELQQRLVIAENKKEIITEGYGEHDDGGGDVTLQDFSQLQEKARHVLSNGGGDCPYLMQIIEELCKQSDKLVDDAKREKEDLQQQQVPLEPTSPSYIHRVRCRKIDAADKQLRATRRFLEEQANEREAERDESARQIQYLQEQLREREREKERDLRITHEVEALESQMREMSSLMSDTEAKKSETESELKVAIDKIWLLRDVVTDLEQRLQVKVDKEEALEKQIKQLETVIATQTKNQQELVQELDAIKMGSENRQLMEHINRLEEELSKHKLSSEHFNVNSSALKQMKTELREMQNLLDKRIKDLESIHMCGSNLSLSQPSEDVSIREQIDASRCITPDDPTAPPMLPLDQILKLKEKMFKQARAEEVAFKRIKDLEMQLNALKNQNEELQAEQEILQQTASEQLFQIEAMRGRLEHHKQSAPFAQRQATSRLELQLHEANTKFQSLERVIADKDLELKDLRNQLDRANQLLSDKEAEITNVVQLENITIQKLKDRVQILEDEKKMLQVKIGAQEHAQKELPHLIDTMLADKNEEIDHLKQQILKKDKQLELYSSLPLDDVQLKELAKESEAKTSARTLSDILSIHSECEEVCEPMRAVPNLGHTLPQHNVSSFKITTSTSPKGTLDASTAPLVDTSKTIQVPLLDLGSSHSQSLSNTCPRRLSSGMDVIPPEIDSKMLSPADHVSSTSNVKSANDSKQKNFAETYTEKNRSDISVDVVCKNDNDVESLRHSDNSESTKRSENISKLNNVKIQDLERRLNEIEHELHAKSMTLDRREAELNALQKEFEELQTEFKETVENLSRDKFFYKNQYELMQVSENKIKKDLLEVENSLKLKTEELEEHRQKMQVNEKIIMELNTENMKLKKGIEMEEQQQIKKYADLLQEKSQELHSLKGFILEKDITIETIQTRNIEIENENKQLYEYKTKYQCCKQDLLDCQNEIQRLTEGLNNRDQIIKRLEEMARRTSLSGGSSPSGNKDQEIQHLQEYLKEKDRVIRQMSDDSKSLHKALETIQNKIKESGNVIELRKKLKEERLINSKLSDTVEKLRNELEHLVAQQHDNIDIEDLVQRELDLSAHLDKQIMSVIENETEGRTGREVESYQCSGSNQYENIVHKYIDAKQKLKHANKINEELIKLKDELEVEKEVLKCQVAEYESRILQIKADLTEETKKVAKLDEELSSERNVVRLLKIQIEKEQRTRQSGHSQDSELIEFLQAKLKSSLESEEKLRNELASLRQEHMDLEVQLSSMAEQMQSQKLDKLPAAVDLLEVEQKKYISLVSKYEKEQRNNAELRDTLKKTEKEKDRYKKQLEITTEEKEELISSLALVEGIKEHLETDLKRTKEELKTKEEECDWLQKRIKTILDAENKRQEQRTSEQNELKSLRREIDNTREVMMDLEADMKQSKRELTESVAREMELTERIEALKTRETELQGKLSMAKDEEKKLKEIIAALREDLKASKQEPDLVKDFADRSPKSKDVPIMVLQELKELSDANKKHINEKVILENELWKMRSEKEQLNLRIRNLESQLKHTKGSPNLNVNNMDYFIEKLQHFYGKYLRVDSRRKALQYQKRYLLCVVGGYQLSEENTLTVLAQLTLSQRSYTRRGTFNNRNPRTRFRSVVFMMISIYRMKWLIVRWRTGRRVGANVLLKDLDVSYISVQKPDQSPPVRERTTAAIERAFTTPAFEQYYQRLRNIQQTLGLAMAEPVADNMNSE